MQPARIHLAHVLCPTDFSAFSARALRHAMALARRFEAQLTVLHVIPEPLAYGAVLPHAGASGMPATDALRKQVHEELARFVEPALLDRVRVSREVREGAAWREIREVARSLPADLVVMGTHGRGGFERFVLGSVTEQLMRTLECPVLTVCHEEGRSWAAPGLLSRILCATDLSESSEATVAFASSLAAESQAHVTFLHAVEELPEARDHMETLPRRLHEAVGEEARAWCEVEERIEVGRADRKILERSAQDRADLIVIGDGGGGGLLRALFGSTAQRVVREATCPVLSVRRGAGPRQKEATGLAVAGEVPPR